MFPIPPVGGEEGFGEVVGDKVRARGKWQPDDKGHTKKKRRIRLKRRSRGSDKATG